MTQVERLLRRERAVVGGGLAALTLLAWIYLAFGAGHGVRGLDMTQLVLFPHRYAHIGPAADGHFSWAAAVAMWWIMMIAMMTPSVAPLVLLYGRVVRQAAGDAAPRRDYRSPALLVSGYLTVWLAFSMAAATLQELLLTLDLASDGMLASRSASFSAAVLAAAGLYQLSPLKQVCLSQCRGPVAFLTRYARRGAAAAFLLGARHGAWCVGCCWVLMLVLFVGGMMNLVWIASLTGLVLIEKLAPAGPYAGRACGVMLLVWAAATLAV